MSEQSVFTKKHSEAMDQDKKAILEELNLPPSVVTFIRTNQKVLKIAIAVAILSVIGWEGYGKYTLSQQEKSSSMLHAAIKSDSIDDRVEKLQELSKQFTGKTGSGIWGSVELGHVAYDNNDYQKAVEHYSNAITQTSTSNPIYPLLQYSLAQTYENMNELSKSKNAYEQLKGSLGFAGEAYMGLARLAEKADDLSAALNNYQEFLNLPETQPGPLKDWAEAKIAILQK